MTFFGQGLRRGKGETRSHEVLLVVITLEVILLPLLPEGSELCSINFGNLYIQAFKVKVYNVSLNTLGRKYV